MIFALTVMGSTYPRGSNNFDAKLIVDLLVSFVIVSNFLIMFSSERDSISFVEFHVSPRIFVV